jgi:hypothetical protein
MRANTCPTLRASGQLHSFYPWELPAPRALGGRRVLPRLFASSDICKHSSAKRTLQSLPPHSSKSEGETMVWQQRYILPPELGLARYVTRRWGQIIQLRFPWTITVNRPIYIIQS